MTDTQLYEDTFTLTSYDKGNYDRIARVAGSSTDSSTILTLDINTDLLPLAVGDHISILLASSLNLDGSKEEPDASWRERREPNLADAWDYVCYGRIYKFDEAEDGEAM
jgi:DNA-directed RNA polymerase I, II, and III subunit RPABC3